ncbi:MAG: NAD(P)-binding domain-containing protein [Campylobacteraceae bacterium]|jgi:thioredoxin reductase (NADPH)|nr:NAD(P)-binding domain-containing protein [Campylobacteraceae bacterium]
MQNLYDVIIVGGGPAGIGAAVESSVLGIKNILLIEKGDNHSQTIRKFYKDNKRVDKDYKGQETNLEGNIEFMDGSKESTISYFDKLLDQEKIDTAFNSEVESIEKAGDIFRVSTNKTGYLAKNIIIAIGKMGRPNKPSYKIPLSVSDKVNFNINKCSQGESILVVGGGNSAAEYAVGLSDSNNVTLNYRKDKFTRLNEINEKNIWDFQKQGKLSLLLGIDIKGLENEEGDVKVLFDDETSLVFNRVVYAIGGTTPIDFLKKCNILSDEKGHPIFDENFETSVKNMYICGDVATTQGGSIAIALNQAYKIIAHAFKK